MYIQLYVHLRNKLACCLFQTKVLTAVHQKEREAEAQRKLKQEQQQQKKKSNFGLLKRFQ
jgi:hypothetical protein